MSIDSINFDINNSSVNQNSNSDKDTNQKILAELLSVIQELVTIVEQIIGQNDPSSVTGPMHINPDVKNPPVVVGPMHINPDVKNPPVVVGPMHINPDVKNPPVVSNAPLERPAHKKGFNPPKLETPIPVVSNAPLERPAHKKGFNPPKLETPIPVVSNAPLERPKYPDVEGPMHINPDVKNPPVVSNAPLEIPANVRRDQEIDQLLNFIDELIAIIQNLEGKETAPSTQQQTQQQA